MSVIGKNRVRLASHIVFVRTVIYLSKCISRKILGREDPGKFKTKSLDNFVYSFVELNVPLHSLIPALNWRIAIFLAARPFFKPRI